MYMAVRRDEMDTLQAVKSEQKKELVNFKENANEENVEFGQKALGHLDEVKVLGHLPEL